MSRMSLISASSASALSRTATAHSRCSGVKSVCSSSPFIPMTPFIGVRISCDMLARKSDLARLALSAASRACSACRCATAICSSAALRSVMSVKVRTAPPPGSGTLRNSIIRPLGRRRSRTRGSSRAPPRLTIAFSVSSCPYSWFCDCQARTSSKCGWAAINSAGSSMISMARRLHSGTMRSASTTMMPWSICSSVVSSSSDFSVRRRSLRRSASAVCCNSRNWAPSARKRTIKPRTTQTAPIAINVDCRRQFAERRRLGDRYVDNERIIRQRMHRFDTADPVGIPLGTKDAAARSEQPIPRGTGGHFPAEHFFGVGIAGEDRAVAPQNRHRPPLRAE